MVRNAAGAPYINEISRQVSSQYFLIRQKEKCGRLRFTLLRAQTSSLPACLSFSFNIYTQSCNKIIFPVRAHAERMTVIQGSTLASARRLYFRRNYSWGNLAPRTISSFSLSHFSLSFFLSAYVCMHGIVDFASYNMRKINRSNLEINIFHDNLESI